MYSVEAEAVDGIAKALAEKYATLGVYREVVDVVPVPTLITGKDGVITHVNPAYCSTFLLSQGVAVSSGWKSVVVNDDLARVEGVWSRVVSLGSPEWTTRAKFVSGHEDISCSIKAVRLSNGGYVIFVFPACVNPVDCPIHSKLLVSGRSCASCV